MRPIVGSNILDINKKLEPCRRCVKVEMEQLRGDRSWLIAVEGRPPHIDAADGRLRSEILLCDGDEGLIADELLDCGGSDRVILAKFVSARHGVARIVFFEGQ